MRRKVEVRSGNFTFTFKKYTNKKVKDQVREISEMERRQRSET